MSSLILQSSSWLAEYKKKLCTAEQAMQSIKSGDRIYIHSNAAAPDRLINALVDNAPKLHDVQIYHLLTLANAPYAEPQYHESFRTNALFIGSNIRSAVNSGRADYTPVYLSDIPSLFLDGIIPIDVCLIQVSPPDAHGYVSLGVSVDCTIAARKSARLVIAEVNKQMPRTLGRSFVHISRLTHIVETDRSLPELAMKLPTPVENEIGKYVASIVDNGATLQLGIGAIPNAILKNLEDKKNLGIHSEMVSDGIIDLIECGVITNNYKTILPGKVAVSFVIGSKRLYDFVDNNPLFEFQTSDYINDPFVIAQNYKMTAINSALQIDLSGQVSADTIGTKLYSGFGGQVDFIRGASRSKGGKAIIALPSTAKNGTISRIVPQLCSGDSVVTTRADVQYVVTEYGIAQLHGKNLRERAKSLIAISHPAFREQMEKACQELPWLS